MLHRDLYRGVSVWNRSQQSDAWGQRAWRARPESDWIRTDVPDLRVVSDQEWDAAHRRLKSAAAVYLRSTNGHLWGRPPSGIESKYLLSGPGQCACCGASMTVRSSSRGRRRHFYLPMPLVFIWSYALISRSPRSPRRAAAKVGVHNFLIWFSTSLGRPPLAVADLLAW